MVVERRGFGVVRAIFAMVIAGLIVYALIYYGPSIWRRITSGGGTSLTDVYTHPSKYLGKEITVYGSVAGTTRLGHYENWNWINDNIWILTITEEGLELSLIHI